MPPRAIKHQLICPFELTSGSFLIGRRRILVIPGNHLVCAGFYCIPWVICVSWCFGELNCRETYPWGGGQLHKLILCSKIADISETLTNKAYGCTHTNLTDKYLVIIEACHGFASKETMNSLSITEKHHMTGYTKDIAIIVNWRIYLSVNFDI